MTETPLFDHALELRVIGTAFSGTPAAEAYVLDHALTPDHFTLDAHRTLWAVITERLRVRGDLDDIVLRDMLDRRPDLVVGGVDRDHVLQTLATALEDADPDPTKEHARILQDLTDRRRLSAALAHAQRHVLQFDRPLDDTITALTEATYGAALQHRTPEVRSVAEVFDDHVKRWENPGPQPGYSFGYHGLDRVMSIVPGAMTVIGARPSVGKSLFVQQVVSNVVHRHQVRAVLVSMEMSERELMDRIVANEARVSAKWLARAAKPKDDGREQEWRRVLSVGDDEAMRRFGMTDTPDVAAVDIEALARRYRAQHPDFKLLVVDYLGLVRQTDPKQLPVHALGDMARRLKVLAIDMDLAVIVLAQLNRQSETERRPPRMSDLRDSGAIEQHADNVLLLHAEDDSPPGGDEARAIAATQVIVGKNRSGVPGGKVPLGFEAEIPRFTDASAPRPNGVPLPDVWENR